jgi:hypothetical protein
MILSISKMNFRKKLSNKFASQFFLFLGFYKIVVNRKIPKYIRRIYYYSLYYPFLRHLPKLWLVLHVLLEICLGLASFNKSKIRIKFLLFKSYMSQEDYVSFYMYNK